jgi:UDP-N-acetylglucosamine 4-epimerase
MSLYSNKYHKIDISKYSFLITGVAGFIGSNLVEYLLKYNAKKVRVLDNLSNGYFSNIESFIKFKNFEFIEGDICNYDMCKTCIEDIDFVYHLAALGSVPRSISNPILSNSVNIGGFLNMIDAARLSKNVKKFIYAASSSTYGDSKISPKKEGNEGKPLSPYAVTKAVNEMYADVFSKIYDFNSIGLRYFNIYGPKQNPNNPYAAVIPIFANKIINNEEINIFGDGNTSRDFTFVENAIQANILMLNTEFKKH